MPCIIRPVVYYTPFSELDAGARRLLSKLFTFLTADRGETDRGVLTGRKSPPNTPFLSTCKAATINLDQQS